MDTGLKDRAALVGGASRGIGRAIALGLAREGATVALCARNQDTLDKARDEIRNETGATVLSLICDMSRPEDIKAAVAAAADAFGRLDIVVNNAGGPPTGAFDALDDSYWQHAIDQNLLSAVRTTREARTSAALDQVAS